MTHLPRTQSEGTRYTRVAITLHWSIAVLIVYNLGSGWFMERMPSAARSIHFSAGLTVIALTLLRIVWRLMHRPPPHHEPITAWELRLAGLVHMSLYLAMLAVPLTGLSIVSANPPTGSHGAAYIALTKTKPDRSGAMAPQRHTTPATFWGLMPLPKIEALQRTGAEPSGLPRQKALHDGFDRMHKILAIVMLALLAIHIAGALKHQWFDRQAELWRMGIGRRSA